MEKEPFSGLLLALDDDRSGPFGGGPIVEADAGTFDAWEALVDAGIQPLTGAARPGVAPESLADPYEIADAVRFLANQGARAATDELQLTPLAENWTP